MTKIARYTSIYRCGRVRCTAFAGKVNTEHAKKRRVHKSDIYRESGKLRAENEGLMEDGLGALGVSRMGEHSMVAPIIVRNCIGSS